MTEHETQYVTGQGRPSFPERLKSFEDRSAAIMQRKGVRPGIRYGSHPRQEFDYFPAANPDALLAYFHAGYWQSRDKSTFRFLADSFNGSGFEMAFVNYPLCPDVSVVELIDAVTEVMPSLQNIADGRPLILMGHSAGGHIAIELGLNKHMQLQIDGVVSISGVFDLRPLVSTSLNERLRLSDESAAQASPLLRVTGNAPPALFVVGAAETDAFIQQSQSMATAWVDGGNSSNTIIVEGADHFSILDHLGDPADMLHQAVVEFTQMARKHHRGR